VIEFTGGEWFCIRGRGNVYACVMPVNHEGSLLNTEVLIEGYEYTVIGVETHAVADRSLFKGRKVGILVRGPRKDK